jgi:hypothetical protein
LWQNELYDSRPKQFYGTLHQKNICPLFALLVLFLKSALNASYETTRMSIWLWIIFEMTAECLLPETEREYVTKKWDHCHMSQILVNACKKWYQHTVQHAECCWACGSQLALSVAHNRDRTHNQSTYIGSLIQTCHRGLGASMGMG